MIRTTLCWLVAGVTLLNAAPDAVWEHCSDGAEGRMTQFAGGGGVKIAAYLGKAAVAARTGGAIPVARMGDRF
jgi:hypothetical protein